MIKQKRKKIKREVNLLTDPDPLYVSIVDHGANQTPWNVVKHANKGDSNVKIKMKNKRIRLNRKPVKGKKTATTKSELIQLNFAGDEFQNEEAVAIWLQKYDYSGYTVTKTDDGFVAKSEGGDDADYVDTDDVEIGSEGVTATVGKLKSKKEDTEAEAEDDTSKEVKSDEDTDKSGANNCTETELTRKFDYWYAYLSSGESTNSVLRDGMRDGTPPGFEEIISCGMYALKNQLNSEDAPDLEEMVETATQMATMVYKVNEVFSEILDDGEATDDEMKAAKAFKEELAGEEAANEAGGEEETQTNTSDDVMKSIEELSSMVKTSIEALTKSVSKVETSLKDVSKAVDEVKETAEEAKAKATSTAESVKSLSTVTPTRKSEDFENGSLAAQYSDAKKSKNADKLFSGFEGGGHLISTG